MVMSSIYLAMERSMVCLECQQFHLDRRGDTGLDFLGVIPAALTNHLDLSRRNIRKSVDGMVVVARITTASQQEHQQHDKHALGQPRTG